MSRLPYRTGDAMPRNITVTFDDGTSHIYQNAPDNITPEQAASRAQNDFGKAVAHLDGGGPGSQSDAVPSIAEGASRAFATGVPVIGGLLNRADAATNATLAPVLNGLFSPDQQLQPSLIHNSEPTRPYYISYAVLCLEK